MKKFFTILFIFSFFYDVTFAQSGYIYKSKFVKMTPVTTAGYFIKPYKESTQSNNIEKMKAVDSHVVDFSDGQYITKAEETTKLQGIFSSNIYMQEDSTLAIVLPGIVVRLGEGTSIEEIMSLSGELLSLSERCGNIYYLDCHVKTADDVFALVGKIAKLEGVVWCKPNMYIGIDFYNSNFYQQYYLSNYGQTGGTSGMDINVIPAWNITSGNSNITVAVLDTGVDLSHEDLAANILPGYTVGDSEGLGAPKNWLANFDKAKEIKGHGTACAGIVAAIDNSIGVRGVASGVKILPVNIAPHQVQLDIYGTVIYQGFATSRQISDAILWAGERADVLSLSWGYGENDDIAEAIQTVVSTGRNGKGCVVVAASGNSYDKGVKDVGFPAKDNNVIAVGAINKSGNICNYSQRGEDLDLVAFGGNSDISTTDVMGEYGFNGGNYVFDFGGTSAACPQVAGVAALMLSANPQLTEYQVRTILQQTARDLGTAGWDATYGYGLVDAGQAVAKALLAKASIVGPKIVDVEATYTVDGLLSDTYVTWSQVDNSYTESSYMAYLSTDKSQPNAVTVSNSSKEPFSVILQATVHSNNNLFAPYTLTKKITGDGPLVAFYQEIKAEGDKGLVIPVIPLAEEYEEGECENFAPPPSYVYVWSNNFVGRNVSGTSPQGVRFDVMEEGMIRFEMPSLEKGEEVVFTVSGGGVGSVLRFRFLVSDNPLVNFSITPYGDNEYAISMGDTESQDEWTVEIYDAMGGNKVMQGHVTGSTYVLDTSVMQSGMYAVRAMHHGKIYSGKIAVKK